MNSSSVVGEERGKCYLCRFSPTAESSVKHFWVPIREAKNKKHPALEAEKRNERISRMRAKQTVKKDRDRNRSNVLSKAANAEKRTERNIIKATRNSGRTNRDGDHVFLGQVTLDTKNQSTRDNPVVLLSELEKVRGDAAHAGNEVGGLVIRNRQGVGVVVFHEDDYARLFTLRSRDE